MEGGEIVECGKFEELAKEGTKFQSFVDQKKSNRNKKVTLVEKDITKLSIEINESDDQELTLHHTNRLKLISYYLRYMECFFKGCSCFGFLPLFIIVSIYLGSQIWHTGSDWWLSEWTSMTFNEQYDQHFTAFYYMNYSEPFNISLIVVSGYEECQTRVCDNQSVFVGLWDSDFVNRDVMIQNGLTNDQSALIYVGIGVVSVVLILIRFVTTIQLQLIATGKIFKSVFTSVVLAKISFFDLVRPGRIISRLSRDVMISDKDFILFSNFSMTVLVLILGQFALISSQTEGIGLLICLPALILAVGVYYFVRRTFLKLKRLDSVKCSEISGYFMESANGVSIIRALSKEHYFQKEMSQKIDKGSVTFFYIVSSNRWVLGIGSLIAFGSVLLICSLGILAYYYFDEYLKFDLSYISLFCTYSLASSFNILLFLEQLPDAESTFDSIDRLKLYDGNIPMEVDIRNPEESKVLSKQWPDKGEIVFKNLSMRYRKDLDLVLKDLNFKINECERIGIVGRTGSGKSSILNCILRFVDLEPGSAVEIDQVDCNFVSLTKLRKSIGVIPQHPQLFTSSIRENLDPEGEYKDSEVIDVLEKIQLAKRFRGDLGKVIDPEEFSTGEKQLICLGRVLLRKSKIVLLDEYCSSIDHFTEAEISRIIGEEFSNSTVIFIAHRLKSVINFCCDRIMVIEKGEVAEFDTIDNLLDFENKQYQYFKELCRESLENLEFPEGCDETNLLEFVKCGVEKSNQIFEKKDGDLEEIEISVNEL